MVRKLGQSSLLQLVSYKKLFFVYRQSNSAGYVKKAVKAITDVKKYAKATADIKPLKIKKRPKSSWQLRNFSVKFFTENHVLVAQSHVLQAISLLVNKYV